MYLQLSVVCDEAKEVEYGKLNISGIFNDLSAPGFPAKHDMVLVIVIQWGYKDAGRYDFQIDLIGPGERPSMTVQGHSDVDNRDESRPPPRTQSPEHSRAGEWLRERWPDRGQCLQRGQ